MTIPGLPEDLADDRARALEVPCPGCSAPAGEPCLRLDGRPLELLPAHPKRMRAAGITTSLIPFGEDDAEVWIPPVTDCMEHRHGAPCPHCGAVIYHHRTRRCGSCGRRP